MTTPDTAVFSYRAFSDRQRDNRAAGLVFGSTRQLTGMPLTHRAYVHFDGVRQWCGHNHRSIVTAVACAERLTKQMNRAGLTNDEGSQ